MVADVPRHPIGRRAGVPPVAGIVMKGGLLSPLARGTIAVRTGLGTVAAGVALPPRGVVAVVELRRRPSGAVGTVAWRIAAFRSHAGRIALVRAIVAADSPRGSS